MPYSEAQKRATLKYRTKAYDRIEITTPKGKREQIKVHAEKQGMSLNAYIVSLIEKDMEGKSEND